MEDTLIYWGIHTFDRTKANPFPLEYRSWLLDWSLVAESEKEKILEILNRGHVGKQPIKEGGNVGDEEWSLSFSTPDTRILGYRKYFVFKPDFDVNSCFTNPESKIKIFLPVNLHFEYFEDETGKSISKIDIYRFKTGEINPLIPFEPSSVLPLGPAPLRDSKAASREDSETIAHFFEVVELLCGSSWFRSPPALTSRTRAESAELETLFPNIHEMQEVILSIRQLYASDDLFNRAVNCHSKLCGDSKKVAWVGTIKKHFNDLLAISLPGWNGLTTRELMDVFLYGRKFAHAREADKEKKLHELISKQGRGQFVMAVQMAFRRVVGSAQLVYPVLRQDYLHWLQTGQCPVPSPMALMSGLLSSGTEPIDPKKVRRQRPPKG